MSFDTFLVRIRFYLMPPNFILPLLCHHDAYSYSTLQIVIASYFCYQVIFISLQVDGVYYLGNAGVSLLCTNLEGIAADKKNIEPPGCC